MNVLPFAVAALIGLLAAPATHAQTRAQLAVRGKVDTRSATISLEVQAAPHAIVHVVVGLPPYLRPGIQTPWGTWCVDPSRILAVHALQTDASGLARLQATIQNPFTAFALATQGVLVDPLTRQPMLTNASMLAMTPYLATAPGTSLSYNDGVYEATVKAGGQKKVEVRQVTGKEVKVLAGGTTDSNGELGLKGPVKGTPDKVQLWVDDKLVAEVQC